MPKVLIFGQSFNSNTGGGVTLSNLFSEWAKDDLAVLCTTHANGNISADICDNYYFIGSDESSWKYPFRYFQRRTPSGKLPIKNTPKTGSFSIKPNLRDYIIHYLLFPFLQWTGLFYVISKMEVSDNLIDWVEDFSPDLLYVQVNSREALQFATKLTAQLKIPMVLHQMDDWLGSIGTSGLGKKYWMQKINQEFKVLAQQADLCLSICDYMGEEYEKRYGVPFKTYHNPVDLKKWMPETLVPKSNTSELTVLYAGRTGFGIESSLKDFAEAVELHNSTSAQKIKFVIQTAEVLSWPSDFEYSEHRDLIAYEKLPHLFQSVDFLLLPCDFTERAVRFLKYSMPTKASEYMVSGTPIIIFSPEEIAIHQYGKSNDWAFLINTNNRNVVVTKLKEIIADKKAQFEMAEKALQLAKSSHSKKVVAKKFYDEFSLLSNVQKEGLLS